MDLGSSACGASTIARGLAKTSRSLFKPFVVCLQVNPRDDIAIAEKSIPIDDLSRLFPFHGFFSDAPQPLFAGKNFREDYEVAQSCWRYIEVRIGFFNVDAVQCLLYFATTTSGLYSNRATSVAPIVILIS